MATTSTMFEDTVNEAAELDGGSCDYDPEGMADEANAWLDGYYEHLDAHHDRLSRV